MGHYQDALDYIFSYVNYEKQARFDYNATSLDLNRMRKLLDRLGNPQKQFRCVHIAGTKGKGSTSALIESVLRAAGYRTGLYTSPHMHTFRERIRVDGKLMRKTDLVTMLAEIRPAIEAIPDVTTFEIMTGLGFYHFAHQGVEWAVLETGLGGRLDATNVVQPAVCAITSLSFDHMDVLGHSLALIAQEKAGIIKNGVRIISAPQEPEAQAVIRRVSAAAGAPLAEVDQDWIAEGQAADRAGQTLTVRRTADGRVWPDLRIALLGQHQLINAAITVAALTELQDQGVAISDAALRQGLAQARWPGRFEILSHAPALVVDCAHNTDSVQKLQETLGSFFPRPPYRRLVLVFGASSDKDISGMWHALLTPDPTIGYTLPDKIILTRSGHPRQADPAHLAEQVREFGAAREISTHNLFDSALAEALDWAKPDDIICVTGSVFIVAQARRAWAKRHPAALGPDDWVFQDETAGEPVPDDNEL